VARLTDARGAYDHPSWSPDGALVALLGYDDPAKEPQNTRLGVVAAGGGAVRWISTAIDRNLAPFGGTRAPVWDGDGLLAAAEDRGDVHLYRFDAAGTAPPALVVGGARCALDHDLAGGTLAFAATTPDRPAEIFTVRGGQERRVSLAADAFVARARPVPAVQFTAPSIGGVEVDVWVYLPPGFDPAGRYPALLNIHGGPFTQYGNRFFDEAQVQAAAGFVVVMPNPRGSSGREQSWARAIVGPKVASDPGTSWGSVDYDDVMAAMDEALRRYPAIDPARTGVLGGSYGGYMTTWIVAHTDRFRAACSERAVNDMILEETAADIASGFRRSVGPTWYEDPDEYRRISPITYVQAIDTPLLILHSEDDLRCPIAGAEQLFVALRLLGKEVEFYRFPAEGHELSRSGSPVHRIQRAELILDWFRRHLPP
jgi:dipeptidyl aminopeptidase/acylaminoacyl peptidase